MKHGRSDNRRSPVSPRPHRSSRTYPSKQANGHDCTAWGTPRYKFSVSVTRVLIFMFGLHFGTLDYWSVGVLKDSSGFAFNPLLHYSITHSLPPRPWFHRFYPNLQQARPGMRQGAVQSRLQITRPLDALAIGAECPRHRGVIASQRDADLMPFKTLVKRLPTSTETFVVQNYCQGPDVVACRSFDLHASQTEGAISRDIDHGFVGMGQFRAHRGGRGPAHRAGAAKTDEAVGEKRLVMVRDIGTGHAGIVQQNRIASIEAIGQIPTGAIGIHRDFVGSEPLVPGIQPLFFKLADFFGHNPTHPLAPTAQFLHALLEQCL